MAAPSWQTTQHSRLVGQRRFAFPRQVIRMVGSLSLIIVNLSSG